MGTIRDSHKCGLILLALVTLLFRYPLVPSPTGSDNFYYISMTSQIIQNGQIFWAENSLSLYGLFPGTTPAGVSIFSTAFVQLADISIFQYTAIHGAIFSIIGTFGFFVLSGEFTKDYRNRWISTLCFSLAPRFLTFSVWRISLRFAFIALLPIFLFLILRLSHSKYGRHPLRIIFLISMFLIILPSLHRMALLIPGIILSYIIANILFYWQEIATNRERAGRQTFCLLSFFSVYLFYLQYLDFSPYSPDDELIGVYFFSGAGIISSFLNLVIYYIINVGPIILVSVLGVVFWLQEGRAKVSYLFTMSYLTLACFIISDIIYIPYLFTFGIILLIIPGFDFITDNLQDYPKRLTALFISLIILLLSFSYMDLNYRLDSHNREELYYSYYIRDSSISASYWMRENTEKAIFESNDNKRERRISAFSNIQSDSDLLELSSNIIEIREMEIDRISIGEMYWNSSDHLWVWENSEYFLQDFNERKTLSVINLAMPNMSGHSSTGSLVLDYRYKYMPSSTYKIYSNDELAVYWTRDY